MDDVRIARMMREVHNSPPLRFLDDIAALKQLVAKLVLAVGETRDDHERTSRAAPGAAD